MTGSVAEYYHWEEAGRGVRIYMHAGMADRLQSAIAANDRETGGILLGRVETDHGQSRIYIDDYLAVDCSHREPPHYELSAADEPKFESALLKAALAASQSDAAPGIVGYFRSHLRDGLSLGPADLRLIESYFPSSANVFLIVKPAAGSRACTAGFFFWEDGRIIPEFSALEVALGRMPDASPESAAVPSGQPATPAAAPDSWTDDLPEDLTRLFSPAVPEPPQLEPAVPAPDLPRPEDQAPATVSRAVRWPNLVLGAATVCIAVAALVFSLITYFTSRSAREQSARTHPATTALGLRVERNPPDLLVSWDPESAGITSARRGTLEVRDGSGEKVFPLDPAELTRGSRLYTPRGKEVQFRLEVFAADGGSVAQTVRIAGFER